MIVIVIVIVIVLSRGYDRGADIRVSYARTGCLVDMVTGEYHMRDGTSRYMVTGEFHMHGFRLCVVYVYGYGRVPYAWISNLFRSTLCRCCYT